MRKKPDFSRDFGVPQQRRQPLSLGKDEVPGPNPGSSSNETLVERRGLLVSMGKNRPHPFAAIFGKGCGLFYFDL